jgi:hypothetical protein
MYFITGTVFERGCLYALAGLGCTFSAGFVERLNAKAFSSTQRVFGPSDSAFAGVRIGNKSVVTSVMIY